MIYTIRRSVFAAAAMGAFALAGCGSSGDTVEAENESAQAVAEKVADTGALRPSPGRWETNLSLEKIDIPGMPEEMQGVMKNQMGKMNTSFSCLTPEEAEKPGEDFFQPDKNSDCTYEKFSLGGGKIEAVMTCSSDGQTQNVKMNGTYSEDAYNMNVEADGTMGPGQPMSMAMSVSAKRVGDCDGTEES